MPVVVGPGTTTPSTPVVGTDGVLTVTPRSEWAAVKIKTDFTAALSSSVSATIWTTTVTRSDGGIVRGLDSLVAPRGVCVGWDQEFTLGAATTWVARGYTRAGVLVATSTPVSVTMARGQRTWIKDLTDPRLSTQVYVPDEVSWQRDIPQSAAYSAFGRFASVASGRRHAGTGQLVASTVTLADQARMRALLNGGPAYLVQCGDMAAATGVPDVYVTIGSVPEQVFSAAYADRDWTLPVTRIARPATAGSSIPIPGLTFAEAPVVSWSSQSGRLVDYAGV